MTTKTMDYPTGAANAPTPSWAKAPPPPQSLPVRTTTTTTTPDVRMQQQRRPTTPGVEPGVDRARAVCEFSVGEYAAALRAGRRYGEDAAGAAARQRAQQDAVVHELRALRRHVDALSEAAAAHRWRRWLIGGIAASIIPIVRRFFRRRSSSASSSPAPADPKAAGAAANATEHAFARSKSLIARILASVRGRGALASVAFFVLAVLYVFANEVSLRVARTVGKRLKRLTAKVERGDAAITDKDMKVFQGWRWRVLTWTE